MFTEDIGENGRVVMTGAEGVNWCHIHPTHGFQVFDTIPPVPLQSLPRARPPKLRSHQSHVPPM